MMHRQNGEVRKVCNDNYIDIFAYKIESLFANGAQTTLTISILYWMGKMPCDNFNFMMNNYLHKHNFFAC